MPRLQQKKQANDAPSSYLKRKLRKYIEELGDHLALEVFVNFDGIIIRDDHLDEYKALLWNSCAKYLNKDHDKLQRRVYRQYDRIFYGYCVTYPDRRT